MVGPVPKPHVLIILDGWGHRESSDHNAIKLAKTPVWDDILLNNPSCLVSGSGTDVGLPHGQMGNSEVGHMSLGAGRVVEQDFTRISKAVSNGSFFRNEAMVKAIDDARAHNGHVHLFGLVSKGGVHSHEDHINAAIKLAFDRGIKAVYLHAFLDGRDVPPRSALPSLEAVDQYIKSLGEGGICGITGRYYAMDRDNRWDRVKQAYELLTNAVAPFRYPDVTSALSAAYARGEDDEFVRPTCIETSRTTINDGDSVIFMNFRADRARQLTRAFVSDRFTLFERTRVPKLSQFVCLTQYDEALPAAVAFEAQILKNVLGDYLANLGKTQLRLAESEKYAHVTYFFSGGREAPFEGEHRILIPSPRVATYDLAPQMSAFEVTDELVKAIESDRFDFIVCNYANGDMVGHTGKLDAAILAVECIDECLGRIRNALIKVGGEALVTADHGNVEQMSDRESGQAHTAHTSGLVPLVYLGHRAITLKPSGGTLSDIAPTLLKLMSLTPPNEMTGVPLATFAAEVAK